MLYDAFLYMSRWFHHSILKTKLRISFPIVLILSGDIIILLTLTGEFLSVSQMQPSLTLTGQYLSVSQMQPSLNHNTHFSGCLHAFLHCLPLPKQVSLFLSCYSISSSPSVSPVTQDHGRSPLLESSQNTVRTTFSQEAHFVPFVLTHSPTWAHTFIPHGRSSTSHINCFQQLCLLPCSPNSIPRKGKEGIHCSLNILCRVSLFMQFLQPKIAFPHHLLTHWLYLDVTSSMKLSPDFPASHLVLPGHAVSILLHRVLSFICLVSFFA